MALFRNSLKLFTTVQLVSRSNLIVQSREIKRWVAPTLKELRKRKKKMGPEPIQYKMRSNFIEWNYNAELFAFSKRLNEEFDMKLLQQAFIDRSYIIKEEIRQRELGIENPQIDLKDNHELIEKGDQIISDYVNEYLKFSLPNVPSIGLNSIHKYLKSEDILSHIALNIGVKDLILSSEYPPENKILMNTFKAIIGALYYSSGDKKAYTFVRDFICTQLNQKDLSDIWKIEKPFEMLKEICKERNLNVPEPRLIGECGKNTVLATYHVGIYSNKKLIGTGYGESVDIAVDCAALDSLRTLFGIEESMKPFDFNIGIERISNEKQKLLSENKK